jgi:hypothetical protein
MTEDPHATYSYLHEVIEVQDWFIHIGTARP